jgi:hypothetical protein
VLDDQNGQKDGVTISFIIFLPFYTIEKVFLVANDLVWQLMVNYELDLP